MLKVLNRPEIRERFFRAGMETVGSTPEALAAMVKADMEKFGKIVKEPGR